MDDNNLIEVPNFVNEWWAYSTNKSLLQRLRMIVIRANWNKRLISKFKLNNNDIEIHKHRFDNFIKDVKNIKRELKQINMNYTIYKQRINNIINILIKLRNYEN